MADALSNSAPAAAAEINSQVSPEATLESAAPAPAADIAAKAASGEALTKKEEKVLREYKLKVNGQNKTIKFDPSNDEEMIKYLQKAESSDSKFQEAAQVRKAAMEFIDELKKNPRKVLQDPNIGVDLRKFAEEIMNDAIKDMEKSPEQREREKLTKELEEERKLRKDREGAWQKAEFDRMQVEHERQLESEISAALDVGGLPKTPRTVKAMAEMMMIALENGIELTAQEIAPIIKSNTLSEFKEVVASLGDDQLEDFIGKEVLGRMRKRNLSKAKAVDTANSIKATGQNTVKKEPAAPVKKQTIRDFLKV